jgi:histidinol-phosphate/aromatic aminotransferase/cobyric acid decarboxylase-like protein
MLSARNKPLPTLELTTEARVHGGPDRAELDALGLDASALIDFSASTNPYGPHPRMLSALRSAALGRYPDSSALEARLALGRSLALAADQIVLGNGAADLLWTLARQLLKPGQRVLIVEPTFCEFRAAAAACGAVIAELRTTAEQGFAIDLRAIADRARVTGSRVVYLCSPNTPTGSSIAATKISAWAEAHPELTLVLDQSFLSLSDCADDGAVAMPDNVARVRSLTKDHGIPGVRVGYLLGAPALSRAVELGRPQWTTSAFAQAAAIAACECDDFVRESRERLLEDRRQLERALWDLGIETVPSRTTFCLARLPNVPALRARLLVEHQILVRDCASFGLPQFMRLAAKPKADRERLIEALRSEALRSDRPRSDPKAETRRC